MSTDPSSPSNDPHIEDNVTKQVNEATEIDLWDLDADLNTRSVSFNKSEGSAGKIPSQRGYTSRIHTRKPADLRALLEETEETSGSHPVPAEASDLKPVTAEPAVSAPASDELSAVLGNRVAQESAYLSTKEPTKETDVESGLEADFETPVQIASVGREPADQETQEAQKVDPAQSVKHPVPVILSNSPLSKIEKIAILLLCFVLLLSAALTLIHFSSRVPTRPLIAEKIDFPVSGKIVTITAASTHWRKPVTSGDNADVVRRNTQLIPVVKLNLDSKTGVIRVFFRNEEGLLVGDVITRDVAGDSEITIMATAGFEDLGMHTGYRTGSGKRWLAQVFEAPSATASREDFRKLLEIEIDTQIR
jgi:hypothetical protein